MEKRWQVYRHKTQYYETDQMGLIHHSNYIRWFESARVDALDQMGISYKSMEERGILIPVLSVSCDYKSMVHFGDIVLVIPKVEQLTGVKMAMSYQVIDEASGELRTTGSSKHCFLNLEHRPISVKRVHRDIFNALHSIVGVDITKG